MFSKIATFALMATVAFARPQSSADTGVNDAVSVGEASQQCGNDQSLSCCNTVSNSEGGLLGGVLDGLLGGSCTQVPIAGAFLIPLLSSVDGR
jgi:hypothetical protein